MLILCANPAVRADSGPLIAAASSLRSLWPALMQSYTSHTSAPVPRVSFGSSGLLSTQILNGAPFDIFLSADHASVDRLSPTTLHGMPKVFALGELSLVVPKSSALIDALSLDTLAASIRQHADSERWRIAVPNPVHAPYGKAAREALIWAGIWPLPAQHLLKAENAAQTLQFVKTGAVAAALVPRTLVFLESDDIASVTLPPESYRPIEHVMVILETADEAAHEWGQWLLGKQARRILEDSGLRVSTQ